MGICAFQGIVNPVIISVANYSVRIIYDILSYHRMNVCSVLSDTHALCD